jgi:hypothetical protein
MTHLSSPIKSNETFLFSHFSLSRRPNPRSKSPTLPILPLNPTSKMDLAVSKLTSKQAVAATLEKNGVGLELFGS